MDKDIKLFAQEIQSNTGIVLTVFSASGKKILGDLPLPSQIDGFTGVYADEKINATYFNFSRKGKNYIAGISGATESQKALAFLICKLAGKTESRFADAPSFVRALIMGDVDPVQVPALCKQYSVADKPLFVLAISCEEKYVGEVVDFLDSYNYGGKDFAFALQDDVSILVKYADSVVKEYCSSAEYAETLCRSIYEETGIRIKVGVGGKVSGIAEAGVSFSQAISAVKMMAKIKTQSSVHTYKEFALAKVLEEMPKNRQIDYIKVLTEAGTKQFFADEEMIKTAQAFLDNNLNASETSRVLYIHRNTLNYRLDKIQNLTGFNLRKFADAVTFKMITILYELLG